MTRLTFIGDIALNGEYKKLNEDGIDPFKEVVAVFKNSDFTVGNLEAVCAGKDGENRLKFPRLSTNEQTLQLLKNLKIDLLTLANNHVYDNLADGFYRTITELNRLSIQYLGVNSESNKNVDDRIYTIGDIKVAFLNYVHPGTNPNIPINAEISVNMYDRTKIVAEIKALVGKVDLIVLIPHWGIDNSFFPAPWQRRDAKAFIQAGAHLIIGHHSHTIQGYEKINNSYVFYSLGNFCFSSFLVGDNEYGVDVSRNTASFILNIFLGKGGVTNFEIIPIVNQGLMVRFGQDKIRNKVIRLSRYLPYISILWPFYILYLNIFYKLYFFFFGNGRNPIKRLKMIDIRRIKRLIELLKLK